MIVAISIDPEGTQLVDQLVSFMRRRVVLSVPEIPLELRYQKFRDLSLRVGKVHKCISVSFTLTNSGIPEKINVFRTEIENVKEYSHQRIDPEKIPEISSWGKEIIHMFGIDSIYKAANTALCMYCLNKKIPFIGKFHNGNLFVNGALTGIERPVWTAPLRREVDRINNINLSYYLEHSKILYSAEYMEDYIVEKGKDKKPKKIPAKIIPISTLVEAKPTAIQEGIKKVKPPYTKVEKFQRTGQGRF